MENKNIPTVLVVFGATGDLMTRKIAPAIYHLFENDRLPSLFSVVGVARRELVDQDFRDFIGQAVAEHLDLKGETLDSILKHFYYQQGFFENEDDYRKLAHRLGQVDDKWRACANKLFYLAVPPRHYQTILSRLSESGLTKPCSAEEGWTRVLVEKPFGKNLKEAEELDNLLDNLFKEEQIYRIDHYLAKETLQNIMMFRFANNLLEGVWNNKHIERIEVRLFEDIGIEGRGNFYDGVGALLDVGQNHLLQMLAAVTMNHPVTLTPMTIRREREAVLRKINILTMDTIKENTFRGQYEGYLNEAGVSPDSTTETYFKLKAYIESPRWEGVPILLEGGKKLPSAQKEIIVGFAHTAPCLCPVGAEHFKNYVRFRIQPDPGISIQFWSKKLGSKVGLEKRLLNFKYDDTASGRHLEDYTKILLDCIAGDQTIFSSSQETMSGWRFIDPIVKAWRENVVQLRIYRQDDKIIEESKVVEAPGIAREIKKEIGIVGLGKMGANIALNLIDHEWTVVGFNRTSSVTSKLEKEGLVGASSISELAAKLKAPRVIWVMVPAGKALDEVIFGREGLIKHLDKGDTVIDGGNSFYKETSRRAAEVAKKGMIFVDVGVSGGPKGAREGACLMVGGAKKTYERLLPLFTDLAVSEGVKFFSGNGAGHFVKMVHNGIEYGMMQAIAEGFAVMKASDFTVDLVGAASVYNHGSVIESRLMGWLKNAFINDGDDLKEVSGVVGHTGEALWTTEVGRELHVKTKIIEESLELRIESEKEPSYEGRILTALRDQFGGHGKGKKTI